MHVIAPLIGKVALVQKPFIPRDKKQARDKKSPGTRNSLGQEIPWDKKSPGTRNPPGHQIPRDKKSPGTRNPPGQGIPRDKNPPGNPGQELLVYI